MVHFYTLLLRFLDWWNVFVYLQLGGFDKLALQFNEVNKFVKNNHLTELDEKSMIDYALNGYVSGLNDKYAKYYTAQEWEKFENENKGVLNGIGVRIESDSSGYITVIGCFCKFSRRTFWNSSWWMLLPKLMILKF